MKITVESPAKFMHKKIIQVLESQEDPKYTFIGEDPNNFIALNFDVETDLDENDTVLKTKSIFKKDRELSLINARVIITGNEFFNARRKKK